MKTEAEHILELNQSKKRQAEIQTELNKLIAEFKDEEAKQVKLIAEYITVHPPRTMLSWKI